MVSLSADAEYMGLMMARKRLNVGIAEQNSEKVKRGDIQFKKTRHLYQVKTTPSHQIYESGVVLNRRTNTITTLAYPESVKLREKKK